MKVLFGVTLFALSLCLTNGQRGQRATRFFSCDPRQLRQCFNFTIPRGQQLATGQPGAQGQETFKAAVAKCRPQIAGATPVERAVPAQERSAKIQGLFGQNGILTGLINFACNFFRGRGGSNGGTNPGGGGGGVLPGIPSGNPDTELIGELRDEMQDIYGEQFVDGQRAPLFRTVVDFARRSCQQSNGGAGGNTSPQVTEREAERMEEMFRTMEASQPKFARQRQRGGRRGGRRRGGRRPMYFQNLFLKDISMLDQLPPEIQTFKRCMAEDLGFLDTNGNPIPTGVVTFLRLMVPGESTVSLTDLETLITQTCAPEGTTVESWQRCILQEAVTRCSVSCPNL